MERFRQLSAFQIITASFAAAIAAGTVLLLLPFASHGGAGFMDALFTAVSAVCVTGLVTVDTGTYWTFFGQLVILLLIQIGGMGVVTLAMMLAVFSGRHISLMQRNTLQEAVAAPQLGGLVQILRIILRGTLGFELLGACLMAPVFIADFGFVRGVWFAVFHSVSAFCNAGFDLMGIVEPGSSSCTTPAIPSSISPSWASSSPAGWASSPGRTSSPTAGASPGAASRRK